MSFSASASVFSQCPVYLDPKKIDRFARDEHFTNLYVFGVFETLLDLDVTSSDFSKKISDIFSKNKRLFEGRMALAADCIRVDQCVSKRLVGISSFSIDDSSASIYSASLLLVTSTKIKQSSRKMIALQAYMLALGEGRGHKIQAGIALIFAGIVAALIFTVVERYVPRDDAHGNAYPYGWSSLVTQTLYALMGLSVGRSAACALNIHFALKRLIDPDKTFSPLSVLNAKAWTYASVTFLIFNLIRNITAVAERMYAGFPSPSLFIGVTYTFPLILMVSSCFMLMLSLGLLRLDQAVAAAEFEMKALQSDDRGLDLEREHGRGVVDRTQTPGASLVEEHVSGVTPYGGGDASAVSAGFVTPNGRGVPSGSAVGSFYAGSVLGDLSRRSSLSDEGNVPGAHTSIHSAPPGF
jgi:hypothetical protein